MGVAGKSNCSKVATVSEVLTVGFLLGKEPTVNPKTVDRGYRSGAQNDAAPHP